jgi:hypothetical protein
MNDHNWHLVSSFETLTGPAAFRIAADRVGRLRLPVARFVNGAGEQALAVPFSDFCSAGQPEVVCHLTPSDRQPTTEADWLVIVSRATDVEALLGVVENKGPARVRPQWLAASPSGEHETQGRNAGPVAGRLELRSDADSTHTLELHALPGLPSRSSFARRARPGRFRKARTT